MKNYIKTNLKVEEIIVKLQLWEKIIFWVNKVILDNYRFTNDNISWKIIEKFEYYKELEKKLK